MEEVLFRFEDMEIWQESLRISDPLFKLAKMSRDMKHYSLSDQLFRATLSISNNIAEGAGSNSNKDFAWFLIISRRSLYECVNILYIYYQLKLIELDVLQNLKQQLYELSKKIYYFRLSILKP